MSMGPIGWPEERGEGGGDGEEGVLGSKIIGARTVSDPKVSSL